MNLDGTSFICDTGKVSTGLNYYADTNKKETPLHDGDYGLCPAWLRITDTVFKATGTPGSGFPIEVKTIDIETGLERVFYSIKECASHIGVESHCISKLKSGSVYRGMKIIKKQKKTKKRNVATTQE